MKTKPFNEEEKQFLKDTIPGRSYSEIREAFFAKFKRHLNSNTLMSFISRNNVYTGRTGQFQKGQESPYKGKPRPSHWKKPMVGVKNGIEYQMYMPIGSTRKTKEGYIEVKLTDSHRWKLLHRAVWESANGPVPNNHVVIFADGNKSNVSIENLMLVSRGELAVLNKFKLLGKSAEITKVGLLVARLRIVMRKRAKAEGGRR